EPEAERYAWVAHSVIRSFLFWCPRSRVPLAGPAPDPLDSILVSKQISPVSNRKLRITIDDLIDAMDAHRDDPFVYFLDLDNGQVVISIDEMISGEPDAVGQSVEAEPDRFEEVPRTESTLAYERMSRFASTVDEDD